jgi:hypothetical protein
MSVNISANHPFNPKFKSCAVPKVRAGLPRCARLEAFNAIIFQRPWSVKCSLFLISITTPLGVIHILRSRVAACWTAPLRGAGQLFFENIKGRYRNVVLCDLLNL